MIPTTLDFIGQAKNNKKLFAGLLPRRHLLFNNKEICNAKSIYHLIKKKMLYKALT
jgi:hypothetical protein